MLTERNLIIIPILSAAVLALSACSTGPTKRSIEGNWRVSENICSSDPAKPDLGDMRSEIRTSISAGTSGQRVISFFYLDRTIFKISEKYNYRNRSGDISLYENSEANPLLETRVMRNNTEVNKGLDDAIDQFFENDPDVDSRKARSGCLFRGQ